MRPLARSALGLTKPKPMTAGPHSLDDLRREIDEIDAALHELLVRRGDAARALAAMEGGVSIRPGREAQILRRLVARNRGAFPASAMVRIWREIMGAFAAAQGPFAVTASAPQSGPDLRELARDHYGSRALVLASESAIGVLRAVAEGDATVGVLPLPHSEEQDPWWRNLIQVGERVPRIVARLPFAALGGGAAADLGGLVVALTPHEDSGDDRSYLVLDTRDQLSRGTVKSLLTEAGFAVLDVQTWNDGPDRRLHLIEVEGCVSDSDPRLAPLAASDESEGGTLRVIGGYAVPLTMEQLAANGSPGNSPPGAAA